LTRVPVTLHWTGHYHEPTVSLTLDLASAPIRDIDLIYDPFAREWHVGEQRALTSLPQPSARVLAMQEHGVEYGRAHRKYCVDGVEKANPDFSRTKCKAAVATRQAATREAARVARPHETHAPMLNIAVPMELEGSRAASTTRKVIIPGCDGDLAKVATERQQEALKAHVAACQHAGCGHVWRGKWGPFIGGENGRQFFDLTACPIGAALNVEVGWIADDPRH